MSRGLFNVLMYSDGKKPEKSLTPASFHHLLILSDDQTEFLHFLYVVISNGGNAGGHKVNEAALIVRQKQDFMEFPAGSESDLQAKQEALLP